MKNTVKLTASLTLISAICAAALSWINTLTSGPIKESAGKAEADAVRAVMPSAVVEVERLAEGVFLGKDSSGTCAGYAAKGSSDEGYAGRISLMVGFEKDGRTLVCYKTLVANETPGLGMKLNSPEFAGQFAGIEATKAVLAKDGGAIEAIAAATITSRAVCKAIEAARSLIPESR